MALCQGFFYVFGTKLCFCDFFQRENNLSSVLSNFSIFILVTSSQMHFIASENFKQKSQVESYYKLVKYDRLGECSPVAVLRLPLKLLKRQSMSSQTF